MHFISGFMELLVLSFLHKNLKMFNAGIILTFVTAFPGGLVLLFWLEIIFSLVKGGSSSNLL